MSQRTINSPGVEIRERDLSLRAPQNVGTNVFVTGFANQGPVDEVLKVTSLDELDQIYGTPTNSSERYFYYTIKELLASPASIFTFRLPYGADSGVGFGSEYSALVYPVQAHDATDITTTLDLSAGTYFVGKPVHINLTEAEYRQGIEGTLFDWSDVPSTADSLSSIAEIGRSGVVVYNKSQTTINSQFEGYYVALADNTSINPATDHNSVIGVESLSLSSNFIGLEGGTDYTAVPNGTLEFSLSSTPEGVDGSVSEIMEKLTEYDIDGREDDDLLNIGVFKLRKSIYATEAFKLDYVLDDAIVGSIDTFRTQLNPTGGPATPFFLETQDSNSRNVEIFINPYVSNKFRESSLDENGLPRKKIRVMTNNLVTNYGTLSTIVDDIPLVDIEAIRDEIDYADNAYSLGSFSNTTITQKVVGSIPGKIDRALETVKNDEIYDIDVVVEAGLGTIWTATEAAGTDYYDDTLYNAALKASVDALRTSGDISGDALATDIRGDYSTVFNKFENFCNLPSNTGGRGDCIFVADPIRHILVTGRSGKILSDRNNNFQTDAYWPIRHQFELENTSYACTYGNWGQVYDDFSGEKVWIPFSSNVGSAMSRSDAQEFPWAAPAGYTRGLVGSSVIDIAINPNQKQRDEFYKSNINPVIFSSSDGIVILGQKTLSRKPSAFDRINVRRLFLSLERPTKKLSKYFLFEPNNEFTQTRFMNSLTPLFEYAKENGGLYDYIIVVDERVNTPEVIDANELRAEIFIKPTRTAEYIIVTFTATSSNASFAELI